MRRTLRAMSLLLSYPSAELKDNIAEVREALHADGVLPADALRRLEPLLSSFEADELLDLQAAYSELFDRSRSLSLHIFEHVHGESRERGQAMIDLGQHYIDHGFIMAKAELPDFLPIFLEFLSCCPAFQSREWLAEPAHVLAALEERLAEQNSPYAAIFHALVLLPSRKPNPTKIAELQERMEEARTKSIDEEWEDAPVNFAAPVQHGGGPTGVIARIRAAQRAVSPRRKA